MPVFDQFYTSSTILQRPNMNPTKVLVFGMGGVGCIYGYFCHQGGAAVTAVCRSNYQVTKDHGIHIRSQIFGRAHYKSHVVRSIDDAQAHGPFDFILVCSKAFPGTSQLIRSAVQVGTTIVLAQNGIGIESEYVEMYPNNDVISGVVYLPTTQTEPGVVEMGFEQRFEIGTFPAEASATAKTKLRQLAALWAAGGGCCSSFDDIQAQRWVKVAVNASYNPICALTLCDDANFFRSSPNAATTVAKVMAEVGHIAKAAGYNVVTDKLIQETIEGSTGRMTTGGIETSMLTDIRNKRPLEVDAILGNTLRVANQYNVATPYLELLYVLSKGLDFGTSRSSGWRPIKKMEEETLQSS